MWKWILQAAVAIGQSEWAKRQLARLIDKILNKAEKKAEETLEAARKKVAELEKAASEAPAE